MYPMTTCNRENTPEESELFNVRHGTRPTGPVLCPPPISPVLGELRGTSPKPQPPPSNQFIPFIRYFPRISPITLGSGTAHLATLPAWGSCSHWWVPDPLGSPDPLGIPRLPAGGCGQPRRAAPGSERGEKGAAVPPLHTHTPGRGWGRRGGTAGGRGRGRGVAEAEPPRGAGGAAAAHSPCLVSSSSRRCFTGELVFFLGGDAARGIYFREGDAARGSPPPCPPPAAHAWVLNAGSSGLSC